MKKINMDRLVWKRFDDQNVYCNIRVLSVVEPDYMFVNIGIFKYCIKSERIERKILDEYKQASQTYGIVIPSSLIPILSSTCLILYDNEKIQRRHFVTKVKHPAKFELVISIIKTNDHPRLSACVANITVNTPKPSLLPSSLPSVLPKHFLDMLTQESKICSICTEPIENDLHMTVCCHLFHKACVSNWIIKHKTCPVCRVKQV